MKTHMHKSQSGHILAVVLVLLFCFSMLLSVMLEFQVRSARFVNRDLKYSQAYYLAESGVEHSLSLLGEGESGNVPRTPLGTGWYEAVAKQPTEPGNVHVVGRGFVKMPPGQELFWEVIVEASNTSGQGWRVIKHVE